MVIKKRKVTPEGVYIEIREYCKERQTLGGHWGQNSYKMDFFAIFYVAYHNGCCGGNARKKYNNCRRKSKSPEEFDVFGDHIKAQMKLIGPEQGFPKEDFDLMRRDLGDWWDEWTLAWDCHPKNARWRFRKEE